MLVNEKRINSHRNNLQLNNGAHIILLRFGPLFRAAAPLMQAKSALFISQPLNLQICSKPTTFLPRLPLQTLQIHPTSLV
jgi:hypothetical protein